MFNVALNFNFIKHTQICIESQLLFSYAHRCVLDLDFWFFGKCQSLLISSLVSSFPFLNILAQVVQFSEIATICSVYTINLDELKRHSLPKPLSAASFAARQLLQIRLLRWIYSTTWHNKWNRAASLLHHCILFVSFICFPSLSYMTPKTFTEGEKCWKQALEERKQPHYYRHSILQIIFLHFRMFSFLPFLCPVNTPMPCYSGQLLLYILRESMRSYSVYRLKRFVGSTFVILT